ncbi:MAG: hypothetical protein OD811_02855 [Alphaproteobacteria bacterium]
MNESPAAEARRLARSGEKEAAEAVIARLLVSVFALKAPQVTLREDVYSLNSLNGFADDGEMRFFFKFHQEEDEAPGEYYNATILAEAGLPVEKPLEVSRRMGEQILLYRRVEDPRFADLCRDSETTLNAAAPSELVRAQEELDARAGAVLCESLHCASVEDIAAEPIHRLFTERLYSERGSERGSEQGSEQGDGRRAEGGRVRRFYEGQVFEFPALRLHWNELSALQWVINGVEHSRTLAEMFALARQFLSPAVLASDGGAAVISHGDAHNANLFAARQRDGSFTLRYYDPAFAGRHVPALLAEIKPTFHNIFAHPFWLYEPSLVEETYQLSVQRDEKRIIVEHNWQLTPLRRAFLQSKCQRVWQPLLKEMARRDLLAKNYLQQIGLALFCCPTLVLPLRAQEGRAGQTPYSSLLGWALAVEAASLSEVNNSSFTELAQNLA